MYINKNKKLILLSLGILMLGFLLFFGKNQPTWALDNIEIEIEETQTDLQDINSQIDEQNNKIDELEAKIDAYEDNIKNKHNEALNLKNQLNVLENDLERNAAEIEKKEAEIDILKLEIRELKIQITEKNEQIDKNKSVLATYLQELYRYEQKTYLEVTFGHTSLSEYSSEVEYVKNLREEFQDTLDDVQELKNDLINKKKEETEKKNKLSTKKKNLEVNKTTLETEQVYKNDLLEDIKDDEEKFQSLVAQVQQEQSGVNSSIAALEKQYRNKWDKLQQKKEEKKQKEEEAKKQAPIDETEEGTDETTTPIEEETDTTDEVLPSEFNPGWPASGEITAYFHDPSYPFKQWFEHSAIDIAIPQGSAIAAADSGYVAIAKYDGSSAYSYVMIVHAEGYSTVYGHLSGVEVSPEQFLDKGETIGYSGGIPGTPGAGRFSTGAHLHFEIRLNGIPVNPLPYLP